MGEAFIGETFLQRTRRMKWLFFNTPSLCGWRLHFSLRLERHFSLGVRLSAAPLSGKEDSDISLGIEFGWLEIVFGFENNPY